MRISDWSSDVCSSDLNTSTGDTVYMRGFDASSSIFVDGIRDLGSVSHDIFNIDQIEVEKGPAGTDNGRTSPSGAINMTTKQANLENALSGMLTTGTEIGRASCRERVGQ